MRVAPIIQFIGIGAIGNQVATLVRPLLADILRQYEGFQPPLGYPAMGKCSLSVICTSQEKTPLKTPHQCLKNARLTFLWGSQNDLDFDHTRAAILADMDPNAVLFTLSMDDSPVPWPVSENECVIVPYHIEGAVEAVALFIEVFVARSMLPSRIGLDWADLMAFWGGKEKRLAVFQSASPDYREEFKQWVAALSTKLSEPGASLGCAWPQPVGGDEMAWPYEVVRRNFPEDALVLFLETAGAWFDGHFMAFLLF